MHPKPAKRCRRLAWFRLDRRGFFPDRRRGLLIGSPYRSGVQDPVSVLGCSGGLAGRALCPLCRLVPSQLPVNKSYQNSPGGRNAACPDCGVICRWLSRVTRGTGKEKAFQGLTEGRCPFRIPVGTQSAETRRMWLATSISSLPPSPRSCPAGKTIRTPITRAAAQGDSARLAASRFSQGEIPSRWLHPATRGHGTSLY